MGKREHNLSKDYNLKALYPALMKEWDYKKNKVSPAKLFPFTAKKAHWVCRVHGRAHEWVADINNRTRGRGCPYCAGHKYTPLDILKVARPDIARLWHPTKNKGLTPSDISTRSTMEVYWLCPQGHAYKRAVNRMVGYKHSYNSCDICRKKNMHLKVRRPDIFAMIHPTLNKSLNDEALYISSPCEVWWKCTHNHVFKSSVNARTIAKNPCPYCAHKRPCESNSITVTHPLLAKQWDYSANGDIKPTQVMRGMGKKYWWVCEHGHQWQASPAQRTRVGDPGCPVCHGRVASPHNNITITHPRLMEYWDYQRNTSDPCTVLGTLSRLIHWKCEKGHKPVRWVLSLELMSRRKYPCLECKKKLFNQS